MTALSIEGLCKSFGNTPAITDVNLSVEQGDLFGLLGPNGSGKTTTLSCALGLLAPDQGQVTVLNTPSNRIHETAGRIGVVFDRATLIDGLSVSQNLSYARILIAQKGGKSDEEILDIVGLSGRQKQRAGQLSLGQRRRLSIGRALIGKPELLILDEPLSGLDALGVADMLDLFKSLQDDGLTLILSTHRLHEMERVVDQVAVLVDGKVLEAGPLENLLTDPENRIRLAATPKRKAQAAVKKVPGVQSVHDGEDGTLTVIPGKARAADLAKAVIDSGCALHRLEPERLSLQVAFERMVAQERGGDA